MKKLIYLSTFLILLFSCRNEGKKADTSLDEAPPQYIYLQDGNARFVGVTTTFTAAQAVMGYDSVYNEIKAILAAYPDLKQGMKFSRVIAGDSNAIKVELGLFIPQIIDLTPPFYMDSIPAGYYASATIKGPFHQIPKTQVMLEQQLEKDKVSYLPVLEEIYYVDIDSTTEVSEWLTEIRYPVIRTK